MFHLFNSKQKDTSKLTISSRDYFLSMGAGKNQLHLINAAKELGYQVIAVDQDTKAPGFENSDLQMYCSLTRPKKILSSLENLIPIHGELVGVGCRSFGRINYSSALIANKLSLPGPNHKILNTFTNKLSFKNLMYKLKIPCAQSYIIKENNTISLEERCKKWEKYLPLVSRPIYGHAKVGVQILKQYNELFKFLEENRNFSEFLFDQYIEGKEVTVLGFVNAGRFHLTCITDKKVCQQAGQFIEYQHHYPSSINETLTEKICDIMQRICDATMLDASPIVAEFLIDEMNENSPLYIIEASPEIGGEYLAEILIPAALNKNYFKDLVHLYTGRVQNNKIFDYTAKTHQVKICFITQMNGTLKKIEFPESLYKDKGFLFAHYLKKPGSRTKLSNGNKDRLAVFAMKAPLDDQEFNLRIDTILRSVEIEY